MKAGTSAEAAQPKMVAGYLLLDNAGKAILDSSGKLVLGDNSRKWVRTYFSGAESVGEVHLWHYELDALNESGDLTSIGSLDKFLKLDDFPAFTSIDPLVFCGEKPSFGRAGCAPKKHFRTFLDVLPGYGYPNPHSQELIDTCCNFDYVSKSGAFEAMLSAGYGQLDLSHLEKWTLWVRGQCLYLPDGCFFYANKDYDSESAILDALSSSGGITLNNSISVSSARVTQTNGNYGPPLTKDSDFPGFGNRVVYASGGSINLKIVSSGPESADPAVWADPCDGTETASEFKCFWWFTNKANGARTGPTWDGWKFQTTISVVSLPEGFVADQIKISNDNNGDCVATLYKSAGTLPFNDPSGCKVPSNADYPAPLTSSSSCPPSRFQFVKAWKSYHNTTGWTIPVAVSGGLVCIDTQDQSTPLDKWGPMQAGCLAYYCQSVGMACAALTDTGGAPPETPVPSKPTGDPGCYADALNAGCGGCADNKCDGYRFNAQKPEGGGDIDRTGPTPITGPDGVDCPSTCDSGWGPDPVADRASRRDVYVCHGAAAPSQPPDDPDPEDYS